jgi:hypothetical protein
VGTLNIVFTVLVLGLDVGGVLWWFGDGGYAVFVWLCEARHSDASK